MSRCGLCGGGKASFFEGESSHGDCGAGVADTLLVCRCAHLDQGRRFGYVLALSCKNALKDPVRGAEHAVLIEVKGLRGRGRPPAEEKDGGNDNQQEPGHDGGYNQNYRCFLGTPRACFAYNIQFHAAERYHLVARWQGLIDWTGRGADGTYRVSTQMWRNGV